MAFRARSDVGACLGGLRPANRSLSEPAQPYRVDRDRERDRGAREEGRAGTQSDEPRPLPTEELDQAHEGEDGRDELTGMPDAATRRDPQDLRREPEERGQPGPIGQASHADATEGPPAHPDRDRGKERVDAGFDLVRPEGTQDGDEGHEHDRREWGEGDVVAAVDGDDVVRAQRERQPRPTVEEGVGQEEEVAAAGVELPVRQPVQDGGDADESQADQRRSVRSTPHLASASPMLWRGSLAAWPTRNTTTSVTQKIAG